MFCLLVEAGKMDGTIVSEKSQTIKKRFRNHQHRPNFQQVAP
jgi:hypothetical protein